MSEKKEKETKPSFIETALLEAEEIQKTAEENAKEILASQMKPEIEQVVREAIEIDEESSIEENLEESHEQSVAEEEVEEPTENVNETEVSEKEISEEVVNENELGDDDGLGGEFEMGDDSVSDDTVDQIDLTDESDNNVIEVFKKMGSEDQIEITQDGDEIQLTDQDKEYLIKLNESEEISEESIDEDCPDHDDDYDDGIGEDYSTYKYNMQKEGKNFNSSKSNTSRRDEGEVIYEIELDEDETLEETMSVTHAEGRNSTSQPENFKGHHRPGDTRYQESVQKNKKLINENKSKNKENKQLISVVKDLRSRLNEVALFNTNLAYVNRLMTEQTTTKKEKISMIKRFDKVKTIDESKSLYKDVVSELNKAPIKESVEKKVVKTSNSSSSKKLNESKKVYDPQVDRMKSLIGYSTNQ